MPSGDHAGVRSITPGVLRQIADVALLGGHGEDLAVRFEHGAHAGGRDRARCAISRETFWKRGRTSVRSAVISMGTACSFPLAISIDVDLPELLVHDPARPGAGGHDLLAGVLDQLVTFFDCGS